MRKLINVLGVIGGGVLAAIIYSSLYADRESFGREGDNFLTGLWATFTAGGSWPLGIYVGPFLIGALFVGILMYLESSNRTRRDREAAAAVGERADLMP